MNRKLNQLFQPSFRLYFGCLIVFALLSAAYSLSLALLELAVIACLALYSRISTPRRRRDITKYLDNYTGTVDTATKDTMVNSPLPMVLFRPESGDVVWTNDRFLQLTGPGLQSGFQVGPDGVGQLAHDGPLLGGELAHLLEQGRQLALLAQVLHPQGVQPGGVAGGGEVLQRLLANGFQLFFHMPVNSFSRISNVRGRAVRG